MLAIVRRAEEGNLRPATEAAQMPSEHTAISRALLMANGYAGVVAWKAPIRTLAIGEPEIMFRAGDVTELE